MSGEEIEEEERERDRERGGGVGENEGEDRIAAAGLRKTAVRAGEEGDSLNEGPNRRLNLSRIGKM